ncbi:MAG: thioredoxin-disulfide reductase [Candidatus Omnitrophica bacterium]|nr:thioredoxin-disulfide reductase [Candidatus Omnitrophota bacterium]
MTGIENVIILGSGCAGLTAAVYAARANLNPLLVEGSSPGGQLALTTEVENYPGFPEGIQGPELMERMKKQAARFGTRFVAGDVTRIDVKARPFTVEVEDKSYQARSLIVATGANAKYIGLPSERALVGHGVSACATCDAFFFKGKEVVVVGGGDTAMEEATFLTKFASQVTVVHRRDALRASKIMQERARANPKIAWVWNSAVVEIKDPAKKQVTSVRLKDLVTGAERDFPCQGIFVAIGHEPSTSFLKGQVELDQKGYLVLKKGTQTSVEGVFGCGDIHDIRYKQAVTAAGWGCMAAIDCERYLEEHRE